MLIIRDALVGTNSPSFEIAEVSVGNAGQYTVTITNARGEVVTPPAQVTVNPPLAITIANLPNATIGQPYQSTLAASGGVSTRTWSLAVDNLPPGLSLTTGGQITGTPTTAARASLTFQVADSSGTATRVITLDAEPIGGFISDPDLILHYTFDEDTGTRVWDSAVAGNNHATDVPGAQWVANGRFGGAYGPNNLSDALPRFFPANQDDLNFVPRGDAFTMSVWLRTTSGGGYRTVLGKDNPAVNGDIQYRLWFTNTAANVQAVIGSQYGGTLVAAPALNDGQWHLLTLVNYLDGATWRTRVYHNDGTQFTQFDSGPSAPVAGLLRIGDTTLGGNGWNGQLDDLRIYRRALTQQEIATLYNPPSTYADWLRVSLTPAQLALPAFTDLTADPDHDGNNNLLEYALGTQPNNAADIIHPALQNSGEAIPRAVENGTFPYLV